MDLEVFADYMDADVLCPQKADKLNLSLSGGLCYQEYICEKTVVCLHWSTQSYPINLHHEPCCEQFDALSQLIS